MHRKGEIVKSLRKGYSKKRVIIAFILIIIFTAALQYCVRNILFEHMVIYNSTVRGIKRGIINKDERSEILIIPEGVKSIGTNAFIDNTDIEEVVLPESLVSIEDYAFAGCTGLKRIKFPQGLKKIGPFSFFGCESLEDIVFPDSLEYLIGGSFASCVNLKKLIFQSQKHI